MPTQFVQNYFPQKWRNNFFNSEHVVEFTKAQAAGFSFNTLMQDFLQSSHPLAMWQKSDAVEQRYVYKQSLPDSFVDHKVLQSLHSQQRSDGLTAIDASRGELWYETPNQNFEIETTLDKHFGDGKSYLEFAQMGYRIAEFVDFHRENAKKLPESKLSDTQIRALHFQKEGRRDVELQANDLVRFSPIDVKVKYAELSPGLQVTFAPPILVDGVVRHVGGQITGSSTMYAGYAFMVKWPWSEDELETLAVPSNTQQKYEWEKTHKIEFYSTTNVQKNPSDYARGPKVGWKISMLLPADRQIKAVVTHLNVQGSEDAVTFKYQNVARDVLKRTNWISWETNSNPFLTKQLESGEKNELVVEVRCPVCSKEGYESVAVAECERCGDRGRVEFKQKKMLSMQEAVVQEKVNVAVSPYTGTTLTQTTFNPFRATINHNSYHASTPNISHDADLPHAIDAHMFYSSNYNNVCKDFLLRFDELEVGQKILATSRNKRDAIYVSNEEQMYGPLADLKPAIVTAVGGGSVTVRFHNGRMMTYDKKDAPYNIREHFVILNFALTKNMLGSYTTDGREKFYNFNGWDFFGEEGEEKDGDFMPQNSWFNGRLYRGHQQHVEGGNREDMFVDIAVTQPPPPYNSGNVQRISA